MDRHPKSTKNQSTFSKTTPLCRFRTVFRGQDPPNGRFGPPRRPDLGWSGPAKTPGTLFWDPPGLWDPPGRPLLDPRDPRFGPPRTPEMGSKTGPDPPKMGVPPISRPPWNWNRGPSRSAVPRKRGPHINPEGCFFEKVHKTLPSRGFLGVIFTDPSFKIWPVSQGARGPEAGFGPPDRPLFAV